MNIARIIARVLVGALFILGGAASFLHPPAQPGLGGAFNDLFYRSHWGQIVGIAQIALGVLLIANRYVPVALIMLAAFLYNSLAYHLTTSPMMLPFPLIVVALGMFVAWPYRAAFAELFTARPIK